MRSFRRFAISLIFGTLAVANFVHAAKNENNKVDDVEVTEESLLAFIKEAREYLKSNAPDELFNEKVEYMLNQSMEMETLYGKLKTKQQSISKLVSQANVKQLESLVGRMKDTLKKENTLRKANKESEKTVVKDVDIENLETVLLKDLSKRLESTKVLKQSEQVIQTWILDIIEDEVEQYHKKILSEKGDVSCPSVVDIVQDVHLALMKFSQDGIGLIDHAQGGEIVHYFTSPTYSPPPDSSDLLGNAWWRKYIPEDWEKLLPSGWETWNVEIPSYVYHSLGIKGSKAAPPETILEKKTVPGACWPMDGNSGQVTFRLPYPVYIDSVTLDHVFSEIIPDEMYQSAPKKIEVIGYPACSKVDDCHAVGFDMKDPMTIARINYDIEGPSFQTFDSLFTEAIKYKSTVDEEDDEEESEDDEEESEDGGTCSTQTSCSSPPRLSVGGITLKIQENWGNPDYTCLYRFRVHGEADL